SLFYGVDNRLQFNLTNQWFNSGNVGIGTANPGYPLEVVGDIYSSGTIKSDHYASTNSTASGDWAVALGDQTTASGVYSTALGSGSTASGISALAVGGNATASGSDSIALGSNTVASGTGSTALGNGTIASANYSTALGDNTTASANFSTALGRYTTAQSYGSLVIGRYNEANTAYSSTAWNNTDPLFVIGNGSSSASLSDAFVVYKDGHIEVTGDITSDGEICIGSGC
ncbi:MAG: hypothetical protein ACD_41C00252G0003, partial [uncultured bacterium]